MPEARGGVRENGGGEDPVAGGVLDVVEWSGNERRSVSASKVTSAQPCPVRLALPALCR